MTRDKFQGQVVDVEAHVEQMAAHAAGMLADGVRALKDLDKQRARSVIDRREQLAQFDEDIETRILRLLTLQSPVARDLRRMGCALKLITYLNRVGRYGYDIARVADDWPEGQPHVARIVSIPDMAAKVQAMLEMVLTAYHENRAPNADELMALEMDVDALRFGVWRECLTFMAQDSKNIEACAHYMMVARYLERCGDNVCKMAEKIHYAATGERLLLH
jgi:phosphate transport system protein